MKYSFQVQNRFGETLRVDGADSFDEAVKRVEKGLYDRDLELARRISAQGSMLPPDLHAKLVAAGEIPQVPPTVQAPAPEDPDPDPDPAPAAPAPAEAPGEKPDVVFPLGADSNPIVPKTLEQVKK